MPVEDFEVVEGTLIVDVFDSETTSLVWQGIGTKALNENPKKREKRTPKSAAKIIADFPVEPN